MDLNLSLQGLVTTYIYFIYKMCVGVCFKFRNVKHSTTPSVPHANELNLKGWKWAQDLSYSLTSCTSAKQLLKACDKLVSHMWAPGHCWMQPHRAQLIGDCACETRGPRLSPGCLIKIQIISMLANVMFVADSRLATAIFCPCSAPSAARFSFYAELTPAQLRASSRRVFLEMPASATLVHYTVPKFPEKRTTEAYNLLSFAKLL